MRSHPAQIYFPRHKPVPSLGAPGGLYDSAIMNSRSKGRPLAIPIGLMTSNPISMTRTGSRELMADPLVSSASQLVDATDKESVQSSGTLADVQITTTVPTELVAAPAPDTLEADTVGGLRNLIEGDGLFH